MEITKSNKTALLVGATGLVGEQLLSQLLHHEAYGKVVALTRRKIHLDSDKLDNRIVDFDALEKEAGKIKCNDIFIALGTTIKKAGSQEAFRKVDHDYILKAALVAKAGGANQCLLVSAAGASADSLIFYNRVKGQTEEAIEEIGFWATHIFRPGVLVGDREEFRLGERIGIGVSNFLRGISPGILGDYNPTQVDVLAAKMIAAAQGVQPGVHVHGARELL
ncbi:NAD(P)H-binding protein [Lewinella sp. W8]|uniref:NAD(P)H-binding protein n=1 Tax=Lewinella sp. W8 TaxID=2528208 RepID=UPI001067F710|nr:NAD(P)H-binding protein [Lewinella sp. W8]MTB51214.1 NAD(P)H-binding protein [Lewinella sp. W8]